MIWPAQTAARTRQPALDVFGIQPAFAVAHGIHLVGCVDIAGTQYGCRLYLRVDRREIRRSGVEQLLEAVDDEVGFLEGVELISG